MARTPPPIYLYDVSRTSGEHKKHFETVGPQPCQHSHAQLTNNAQSNGQEEEGYRVPEFWVSRLSQQLTLASSSLYCCIHSRKALETPSSRHK